MIEYTGKAIFEGIAIGKIFFYAKKHRIKKKFAEDTEGEIARFEEAKYVAGEQLRILQNKVKKEVGDESAGIFEAHRMMLDDFYYNESVCKMIREEEVTAEYAVSSVGKKFSRMFLEIKDEYFKERAADIRDISERLFKIISGTEYSIDVGQKPVIITAKHLTPSETVQMDKSKMLAFVTKYGSSNSHTAILARTMGIPAISGIEVREEWNGRTCIVDGKHGKLILDPDFVTIGKYLRLLADEEKRKKLFREMKGLPDVTEDGKEIKLYANIDSLSEVDNVLENDAAGIGLFRSEFLYLERDNYPTEDEQYEVYKSVAQKMNGKKVVIRTLDIGADKQVDYFGMEKEENPALGYRAIRICLDRVNMFKTQLRAIYRASAFGNISLTFPMIISEREISDIKEICQEVKKELDEKEQTYGKVELGIMVETPAAVMISDFLAKEVDFFCIGTNDLTQYTLAIDRQNSKLDSIYDSHHPAILRMIQIVIENGHKEGCWVGICGELGADTTLTELFIKMGVDELSVASNMVLPVRKAIRSSKYL
ncbi:MAG: phosphoenolpyruvate--protein phosphotransferase [Schaedlerella sp.]|nr:phosphoenolpyruvate--protein phosphotransferase [Schaedlerella sp.]